MRGGGAGKARARVLGRALLAQGRPRPPAPRPLGPAPGSILRKIGLGCDAARGRQVRSGSLPPCAPSSPSVTSPRPAPRRTVRELAGAARVPAPGAGGGACGLRAGARVVRISGPRLTVGAFLGLARRRVGNGKAFLRVLCAAGPSGERERLKPRAQAGGPRAEGWRPEDGPAEVTSRKAEQGNQRAAPRAAWPVPRLSGDTANLGKLGKFVLCSVNLRTQRVCLKLYTGSGL